MVKSLNVTIQVKTITIQVKTTVLSCCGFQQTDKILKVDQLNESYWAIRFCGALYYAAQGGAKFESVDEMQCVTIRIKATEHNFPVVLFIMQ